MSQTRSVPGAKRGDGARALALEAQRERLARQRLRAQARYDTMRAGPYLEDNGLGGRWVVIPSAWFNQEARRFWTAIGCRFLRHERRWVRSTARPYRGRTYTPAQWLRSVRRTFFELHGAELARHEEWGFGPQPAGSAGLKPARHTYGKE